MLKGHVFKNQYFGNPIFALFINTFLNGKNGVSSDYGNSMEVTYSGSNITVDSGAVCIQGRFLEEDTSTTMNAGTDDLYCKLVIEIDLSKNNTDIEFNQGYYKLLTNSSDYPTLTQENIVKNNTGVYQYELARFTTSINGIANFVDKRTFLDFESIYTALQNEYRSVLEELREELEDVEDGSAFVMKNDIVTIMGEFTANIYTTGNYMTGYNAIRYPQGFNKNNCIVLALGTNFDNYTSSTYTFGTLSDETSKITTNNIPLITGAMGKSVQLNANDIGIRVYYRYDNVYEDSTSTIKYKLVLMKIDPDVSNYELGDVNMDGEVTEADYTLLQNFIQGNDSLIDKQFKLADMNEDGEVDIIDLALLRRKLDGNS